MIKEKNNFTLLLLYFGFKSNNFIAIFYSIAGYIHTIIEYDQQAMIIICLVSRWIVYIPIL
jgi:hypothetical protein